jgi:hypothetical protein
MKLYRLEVSATTVVLAESEESAKAQAKKVLSSNKTQTESHAFLINNTQDIPFNVDKNLVPWGANKSILELLFKK